MFRNKTRLINKMPKTQINNKVKINKSKLKIKSMKQQMKIIIKLNKSNKPKILKNKPKNLIESTPELS